MKQRRPQECLRCRQSGLVSNGAFWTCLECGYAITATAIAFERMGRGTSSGDRQRLP
jgi:ribosomal protein L37AE/L43A